nr:MAG TPA: hypothetical protein [Caudoviricetes sp.]
MHKIYSSLHLTRIHLVGAVLKIQHAVCLV